MSIDLKLLRPAFPLMRIVHRKCVDEQDAASGGGITVGIVLVYFNEATEDENLYLHPCHRSSSLEGCESIFCFISRPFYLVRKP